MSWHPSFMVKKTGVERDERFNALSRPPKDMGTVALWLSFDVSSWSARMPWDIQKASHDVWD